MSRLPQRWLAAATAVLLVVLLGLFLGLRLFRLARDSAEGTPPPASAGPAIRGQRLALEPGRSSEHPIVVGELHRYELDLEAGGYLQLVVEQLGIDVEVSLLDPDRAAILVVNSWNGDRGPEPVAAVVERSGTYRLEIRPDPPDAPPGRYRIDVGAHRDATPADRQRGRAARAFSDAEALLAGGERETLEETLVLYRAAADGWRAAGEARRLAVTHARIGWVLQRRGELSPALEEYEKARAGLAAPGESHWLTPWIFQQLGEVHERLGDRRAALPLYRQALAAARHRGDARREVGVLNRLAILHGSLGKSERAALCYEQALARVRQLDDPVREARTLANAVQLYLRLGQVERARALLDDALALSRRTGDRKAEARSLNNLGVVRRRTGRLEASQAALERSLALRRELGDRLGEALTLKQLGLTRLGRGDHGACRAALEQALELARELGDRRLEGGILSNLGWLHDVGLGEPERALVFYRQALEIYRRAADPAGEASALHGAARAERARGDLDAARTRIEAALALVESLRAGTDVVGQRSSYLARRQDYYELYIDLLAELHRRDPAAGWAARALEVSERRRARALLDVLTRSLDPAAGEDLRLGAGAAASDSAPPQVPRLRLADIQRLLDDDTLLLEYSLGAARSFLWRVTASEIELHELPGRERLEKLARAAHLLFAGSHGRRGRSQLRWVGRELAELLLGPVAGRLGSGRLLVVGDGALQYLPFGALPAPRGSLAGDPGEIEPPLVADHPVIYAPSLAVLATLREKIAGRSPAPKIVAVVADPVFDRRDPRVRPRGPGLPPYGPDLGTLLDRLPASRHEAEAILALVPPGEALAALGFAASRETVMGGALADYRLVHFATHTLFDPRQPAFSGLVLSRIDENGRPREGLVRPEEIYGLRLAADMVVLSACRSGLGREVRGEGLVGLTQGFLYAGAARVVVSLWPVDDEAGAELMARLYGGILEQGLPAAEALRAAQLAMLRDPRWRSPYYWAGFFLQGEWRPGSADPSDPSAADRVSSG